MRESDGTAHYPVWHPYTADRSRQWRVVSAKGVRLNLEDGRSLIDGVSSWWSVIHGYAHPQMVEALQRQAERLPHVMLGGLTHEPAERLAAELVELAPRGGAAEPQLRKVFFADSGSVGVEVSLKMAAQYWHNLGHSQKRRFIALRGGYHGDTSAAMSVGEPEDAMHAFSGLIPTQLFVEPPHGFENREAAQQALLLLEELLQQHAHEVAAMILEPIQQCYGGFNMYHPDYLRGVRQLCDRYEVVLIADEVATGLGRTGKLFACDWAEIVPDILVLSKALTGGMLGMSATLATEKIYSAFTTSPESAFMHGPTFMGNALACAAALVGLELIRADDFLPRIAQIERELQRELLPLLELNHPDILDVRILGATGVVELTSAAAWVGLREFAADRGVWLRPFDRYIYTMPAYTISSEELSQVCSVIQGWFLEKRPAG